MSKVIVDEIQTDTTNGNVRVIPNGTGALEVKGAGGDDAILQLNCSAQSHGVKLKSPAHSVGQSYTMILPDNNIAADKYLKVKSIASGSGTSAVGQLEFADVAAGITVQEEGSALSTAATTLNFVGSGVTASGTGATKTITISGGGISSDSAFNTVGGTGAGNSIDTSVEYPADENTIFGYRAGYNLTNDDNVLVGFKAGQAMTTSFRNIAIGYEAMLDADGTTYSNIGIGRHACKVVNEGHSNVAVGDSALKTLGHADYNVAIGGDALESLTTASNNVCVGYATGNAVTTGEGNVFVGHEAGKATTTTDDNVGIGRVALHLNTTGTDNVAVGPVTLYKNTTGDKNVAIGYRSQYWNDGGNNNVSVGADALYDVTTGTNNICIGYNAGRSSSPSGEITTASHRICLGDNNITNLYCADTSISSSDSRDKTDVTSFTIGLNWIEALRPVTYRWDRRTWYGTDDEPFGTPDGSKKRPDLHIGFLAQEALEVEKANGYGNSNDDSLLINLTDDGMSYGIKYERLVPILVNAIKELSTRVKALEAG